MADRDLDSESWEQYGNRERLIADFVAENHTSLSIHVLDLIQDGPALSDVRIENDGHVSSIDSLRTHLALTPVPNTKVQVIAVDQMSGDALRMIGEALNVQMDFWAWVLSEEATDGYWRHDHNGHKELWFDLATIEEYVGPRFEKLPRGYLHAGRLKQISSIHRYTYHNTNTDTLFVTRRCSGILIKRAEIPVLLYVCENAMDHLPCAGFDIRPTPPGLDHLTAPSVRWFVDHLRTRPDVAQAFVEDPFEAVAIIARKQLDNWTMFFPKLAREIEAADDSQSSEDDASDSKLFAAAKSLQQEISLNLTYFRILLEAHEGFLSHVVNQNKKGLGFRPEASLERLKLVVRKATGQKTRADILRNRAQNILDFMLSKITIRQAQLGTEQAKRSVEVALLTRLDTKATLEQGRSMKRLSVLATLFLPASTIAAIMGMNVRELNSSNAGPPIWMYFVIALVGTVLCTIGMEYSQWTTREQWPYVARKASPGGSDAGSDSIEKVRHADSMV